MINILDLITLTNINLVVQIVNLIIIIGIIFLEHKNPQATFAWALVLVFLPLFGLIIYGVFSQNIARLKITRLTADEEHVISKSMADQMRQVNSGAFPFRKKEAKVWSELIRLNQKYDGAYFTQDNKVDIFTDGKSKFASLREDIEKAKEYINIEYFIIKNDEVGNELIELLTKKAKEGVMVRLLMDAMGSRQITMHRVRSLTEAGGQVGFFFKPKFRIFMMRLNYRNHRKLVVIDDRIAYIGGFNVAREYLGRKEKFGFWRDTHARITGSAIKDINQQFAVDWRFTTRERIDLRDVLARDIPDSGATGIQIVSSGPDSSDKEEIKKAYNKIISHSDRTIFIQTPYFVPDESIQESLKMAALSGLDVRIMIPCMPDHIFVYWATMYYVGELLKAGVKVYIYDKGFLHAKTIMADGEVCSIGSANFDNRSFRLNFETNAFIYDCNVAGRMEEIFVEDMKDCHELTLDSYINRSNMIKIKESVSRLFTSVL